MKYFLKHIVGIVNRTSLVKIIYYTLRISQFTYPTLPLPHLQGITMPGKSYSTKRQTNQMQKVRTRQVQVESSWDALQLAGGQGADEVGDADACRLKLELTAADFIVPTVFIPNDVAGFNLIDFSRFGFKLRL